MNKNFMNKVFNIVVGYEEIIQYEETIKILEEFNYDITAENSQDLSLTLNILLDNGYSIQKTLQKYSPQDFTLLDETINKILDSIYTDRYDSIISDSQHKFSDSQRLYMFNKISEKISIENYQYNRLPHLFKMLIRCQENKDNIITFLNQFLDNNLITAEKILIEFCDILETVKSTISEDFINLFISNLIENNLSKYPLSTMKIICGYKDIISIDNIKKIKSYIDVLINMDIYQYVFELYEANYQAMLDNEETREQLEMFLTNYIDLSNDINKTINFINNVSDKITNTDVFLEKYITIDFDNEDIKNNFERLLIKMLSTMTEDEQKNIINIILNRSLFNQDKIKKMVYIFKQQELIDFDKIINSIQLEFFNQNSNNYKLNNLDILIEKQNKDVLIDYLTLLFEDLSDDNFIIEILNKIKNSKMKYVGQYNSKLWKILSDASNSTSSTKVKESFESCIVELRLKEPRNSKNKKQEESLV
ncbi:MAG: hypothetical protein PHX03_02565 [Bacilli bacterium]|nr:hypothetical protein [Bacilli bacterium]